jgi:site-specific DNA-methyltransferase (adenine-specific)
MNYSGYNGGIHPTEKPVVLYKWLLTNYAKPNDKIFDSHVGSGSIRIACHELGFDFTGCELDKDYYEAQEKRYKEWLKKFNNEFYIGDDNNNLFGGIK